MLSLLSTSLIFVIFIVLASYFPYFFPKLISMLEIVKQTNKKESEIVKSGNLELF